MTNIKFNFISCESLYVRSIECELHELVFKFNRSFCHLIDLRLEFVIYDSRMLITECAEQLSVALYVNRLITDRPFNDSAHTLHLAKALEVQQHDKRREQ